jgi:hypothetical protein
VIVGGGASFFPSGLDRLQRLELLDDGRFASGVIHARYGVRKAR